MADIDINNLPPELLQGLLAQLTSQMATNTPVTGDEAAPAFVEGDENDPLAAFLAERESLLGSRRDRQRFELVAGKSLTFSTQATIPGHVEPIAEAVLWVPNIKLWSVGLGTVPYQRGGERDGQEYYVGRFRYVLNGAKMGYRIGSTDAPLHRLNPSSGRTAWVVNLQQRLGGTEDDNGKENRARMEKFAASLSPYNFADRAFTTRRDGDDDSPSRELWKHEIRTTASNVAGLMAQVITQDLGLPIYKLVFDADAATSQTGEEREDRFVDPMHAVLDVAAKDLDTARWIEENKPQRNHPMVRTFGTFSNDLGGARYLDGDDSGLIGRQPDQIELWTSPDHQVQLWSGSSQNEAPAPVNTGFANFAAPVAATRGPSPF